ncbi:MAG: hypothetical protein ABI903_12995 [Actinomycetota bacterium]
MTVGELVLSDDVELAGWIRPRLGGRFGAVTRTLPGGYPAYARICHPATDSDGTPVSWPEVGAVTGRHAHPLMQWHALIGSVYPVNATSALWLGENPEQGHIAPEVFGALTRVLAQHTTTPARCVFCLWEGYGWLHADTLTMHPLWSAPSAPNPGKHAAAPTSANLPTPSGAQQPGPVSNSGSKHPYLDRDGPRVRLPGRDYLLLTGPLDAAISLGWWPDPTWFQAQSPNLFWPADRTWCVATEIDFDSTLVAGTRTLIDALLNEPTLDAWPLDPDDSLDSDADHVNRVP